MAKAGIEEIKNLLNKIIIFDEKYKNNILDKAEKLDEAGLVKIHDMLIEVESWQRSIIEEKLKSDPTALNKLGSLLGSRDRIIGNMRSELHAINDQEKIGKLLSFIDKL